MIFVARRLARIPRAMDVFYAVRALAFAAVAIWAAVIGEWFIAVVAAVMLVFSIALARFMRALKRASATTEATIDKGQMP